MKIQIMAKCEKCGEIYDELGPLHLCADKRQKVEEQDTDQDEEHDNNSRGDWWGKDDNQDMLKEYCEGPVQSRCEPYLGSITKICADSHDKSILLRDTGRVNSDGDKIYIWDDYEAATRAEKETWQQKVENDMLESIISTRQEYAFKALLKKTIPYKPTQTLRQLVEQAKINAGEVIRDKFINNDYVGSIGESAIGGGQYTPEQRPHVKQVMLTLRREDNSDLWIAPNGAKVSTQTLFDLGLIE